MNINHAFPTTFRYLINHDSNGNPIYAEDTFPGMTLRDYFAAKAMTGIISEDVVDKRVAAKWCYEMADAMLAERNKK